MSSDHCRAMEVLVTLDVRILRPAPANGHNQHIMVTSNKVVVINKPESDQSM